MPVCVKFMHAHYCPSSVSCVTQVTKRHMSRVTFEYCVIQLSYSTYVCVCLIILLRSDVQMVKVWPFTSLLSVSHQCDRLWLTPSDNHAVRLLRDILWSQAMITFPFESFLIFLLIPTEKAYIKISVGRYYIIGLDRWCWHLGNIRHYCRDVTSTIIFICARMLLLPAPAPLNADY